MQTNEPFSDRRTAGQCLAQMLRAYAHRPEVLVLGLPRGGVPVAWEVARLLQVQLDILVVRKLGVPGHAELAMGALVYQDPPYLNEEIIRELGITENDIQTVVRQERRQLQRLNKELRGDLPAPQVADRVVILVDDGLATGATMRAGARSLAATRPRRLVMAVPVAARSTLFEMAGEADEIVCVQTPPVFQAVGLWYQDFTPTGTEEVRSLLEIARQQGLSAAA